jgi:hypothetical protein
VRIAANSCFTNWRKIAILRAFDVSASGNNSVRQLPNPAICRAKAALWPGVVHCLVHAPTDCPHARFFNEAAYCNNPTRTSIIARTTAHEDAHSGDGD